LPPERWTRPRFGHFRGQTGARGISSVENLERHGFDPHNDVVRSADLDPVAHLLGVNSREEDRTFADALPTLGLDRGHHSEKLTGFPQPHHLLPR
jgi:hypothetical protein